MKRRSGGIDRPTRVRSVTQIANANGPAIAPRNTAVGAIVQLSLNSATRNVAPQSTPTSSPAHSQRGRSEPQASMVQAYGRTLGLRVVYARVPCGCAAAQLGPS